MRFLRLLLGSALVAGACGAMPDHRRSAGASAISAAAHARDRAAKMARFTALRDNLVAADRAGARDGERRVAMAGPDTQEAKIENKAQRLSAPAPAPVATPVAVTATVAATASTTAAVDSVNVTTTRSAAVAPARAPVRTKIVDGVSVFEVAPEEDADVLVDDFLSGPDSMKWAYPPKGLDDDGNVNASKFTYGYALPSAKRDAGMPMADEFGLWFSGDAHGAIPVRSRNPFSPGITVLLTLARPDKGQIEAELGVDSSATETRATKGARARGAADTAPAPASNATCASHFVVLSTNPGYTFVRFDPSIQLELHPNVFAEADAEVDSESEGVAESATGSGPKSPSALFRFITIATNATNATNAANATNATNATAAVLELDDDEPVDLREGKTVVVSWSCDTLTIYGKGESHSMPCDMPAGINTLSVAVDRETGRVEVTGCVNSAHPLRLLDLHRKYSFSSADNMYVYLGADTRTKSVRRLFHRVQITARVDSFFTCAHRPSSSRLQHDFWEDFEGGKLSRRWVVQRPVSEDASTQALPAYGFGGGTLGEAGVAKSVFWLDGDRGYSMRVRRPFLGRTKVVAGVRKEDRCSQHWIAVSRSKRYAAGVDRTISVFRDPLMQDDATGGWSYPHARGSAKYGRSPNTLDGKDSPRVLHYGYGNSADVPWLPKAMQNDEKKKGDGPNTKGTEEDEQAESVLLASNSKSYHPHTGLWFAGPAVGAVPLRMSDMVSRPSGGAGMRIKVMIDKTHKCSSHFIVLTDDPGYVFAWGAGAAAKSRSVVVGYNCDTKVMYSPMGQQVEAPCTQRGENVEIRLRITDEGIVFEDDFGCPTIEVKGESTASPDFYVFLGASQDTQDTEATARLQQERALRNELALLPPDTDIEALRNGSVSNDTRAAMAAGAAIRAKLRAIQAQKFGPEEGAGRYIRSYFRDFRVTRQYEPSPLDADTVVVGWGCNSKMALGPNGFRASQPCAYDGRHRVELDLLSKKGTIIFRTVLEQDEAAANQQCDSGIGSKVDPEADVLEAIAREEEEEEEEEHREDGGNYFLEWERREREEKRKAKSEERAKRIKASKVPRLCPDIEIPADFATRGVYYAFIGVGGYPSNARPASSRSVFETFAVDVPSRAFLKIDSPETQEALRKAADSELYFSDNFGRAAEEDVWKEENRNGGNTEAAPHLSFQVDKETGERALLFNDTTLVPVRTRKPFVAPFTIIADVLRDNRCSNHYITVSTNNADTFQYEVPTTSDAVRFAWKCDNLVAYALLGRTETKNEWGEWNVSAAGTPFLLEKPCTSLARRQITLSVTRNAGNLVFSDGKCDAMSVPSPFPANAKLYVTLGANPNVDQIHSKVFSFQIYGPPTNMKGGRRSSDKASFRREDDELADQFTKYGGDPDPDMWTLDMIRGASVRNTCGSAKDLEVVRTRAGETTPTSPDGMGALYFGGPNGQRFATTKEGVDLSRGGIIEFWMRMGAQKLTDEQKADPISTALLDRCAYMYDNDGVVIQYSTSGSAYDEDSFKKLWRLPGAYVGERMRKGWTKVRVKVDKSHNDALMQSPSIVLRWKQLTPALSTPRGDWALDMVRVVPVPPPQLKVVLDRSLCDAVNSLNAMWDVPKGLIEKEEEQEQEEGDVATAFLVVNTRATAKHKTRHKDGYGGGYGVSGGYDNRQGEEGENDDLENHWRDAYDPASDGEGDGLEPENGVVSREIPVEEKGVFKMFHVPEKCRVEFTGNALGKALPRAKRMFSVRPGVRVTAIIDKTAQCSDQFLVFSTQRNYRWSYGSEPGTVKFAWNCDHKVVYTPLEAKTVDCAKSGQYEIQVDITTEKVVFKDTGGCQDIELPFLAAGASEDEPLYLFFGGDQDHAPDEMSKASYSSLENMTVSVYPDVGTSRMDYTLLKDDFDMPSADAWSLAAPGENDPADGEEDGNELFEAVFDYETANGTLGFSGPADGMRVPRTADGYRVPFQVTTVVEKDAKCASHFFVISPRKNYRFSANGGHDAITVGWDCDTKYIRAGLGSRDFTSIKCPHRGSLKVTLTVRGSMISFKDSAGCRTLYAANPVKKKRRRLYVYVGADRGPDFNPREKKKSLFHKLEIVGRKPVGGISMETVGTLLADDFNFRCQVDASMWGRDKMSSLIGGRVDKDCGSLSGCSLHFRDAGERSVVTKEVDVSNGAVVKFGLRFGGGDGPDVSCMGLNPKDLDDRVELQFGDGSDGNWTTLARYTARDFVRVLRNFTEMSVYLAPESDAARLSRSLRALPPVPVGDKNDDTDDSSSSGSSSGSNSGTGVADEFSDMIPTPEGICFRWIQPKDNRPCCGHWALDNVQVRALPPYNMPMLADDLQYENQRLWVMPKKDVGEIGVASSGLPFDYGFSETGIWFSGELGDARRPMRGKFAIPYPGGVTVSVTIERRTQCANHFIALTPDPDFTWAWGQRPSDDALVFAFNCDDKYIYAPEQGTDPVTGPATMPCPVSMGNKGISHLRLDVIDDVVSFRDSRCGELRMEGRPLGMPLKPLYVYIGASQDRSGRASFREFSVATRKARIPIVSSLIDNFKSPATTNRLWRLPLPTNQGKLWGMDKRQKASTDGKIAEILPSLWFSANPQSGYKKSNRREARSRGMFSASSTSVLLGIDKTATCSSHYIALTTDPDFIWEWGANQAGALKFAWNCNEKTSYSFGPTEFTQGGQPLAQSVHCADFGKYSVAITLGMRKVTFEDSRCAPIDILRNPFKASDKVYIVIGADADVEAQKSRFLYVQVTVPETPPVKNLPVVLRDRFDFHEDMDRRMWLFGHEEGAVPGSTITTARVDGLCSSLPKPPAHQAPGAKTSLHFGSPMSSGPDAPRLASTKSLNLEYGGTVSFLLTFGWDGISPASNGVSARELAGCIGLQHPDDGIEIRYSVDGGHTWDSFDDQLATFTVRQQGQRFMNRFANVTFAIDYDTAPLAMTGHTMLQFRQLNASGRWHVNENGAATSNWAIASLTIFADPRPLRPAMSAPGIVVEDKFDSQDKFASKRAEWDMFNSSGRPVTGANGKRTLLFGGEAGQDSRLTTSEVDITPSFGDHSASGATFEITLMRNSPMSSEKYGRKNTKNRTIIEESPTIDLQFRLADMMGMWKSVARVSDIEHELMRVNETSGNTADTNSTKTYKFSSDGGVTYVDKSYYGESREGFETYELQANLDEMRPDLLSSSQLWETAEFRLYQEDGVSGVWALDELRVYVGSERRGLKTANLGLERVDRDWCYPVPKTTAPYKYILDAGKETGVPALRFDGPMEEVSTVRSRKTFRAPAVVQLELERDESCANHVIVLSTERYFKWSSDPYPEAIRFAYDCNKKRIIGSSIATSAEGNCPYFDPSLHLAEKEGEEGGYDDQNSSSNASAVEEAEGEMGKGPAPSRAAIEKLLKTFTDLSSREAEMVLRVNGNKPAFAARQIARNRGEEKKKAMMKKVRAQLVPPKPALALAKSEGLPMKPRPRRFRVNITVTKSRIVFSDSLGCETVSVDFSPDGKDPALQGSDSSVAATAGDFWVYLGANREVNATQIYSSTNSASPRSGSGFLSVEVTGSGSLLNKEDGSGPCPQLNDCEVTPFTEWSNCSATCGFARHLRSREIIREAKHGGADCPVLEEEKLCFSRVCDCVVSNWSAWSPCGRGKIAGDPTKCGGGSRKRNRSVVLEKVKDGKQCPPLEEEQTCPVFGLPCETEQGLTGTGFDDKSATDTIDEDYAHYNNFTVAKNYANLEQGRNGFMSVDDPDNWCYPPAYKIAPQMYWINHGPKIAGATENTTTNAKNTTPSPQRSQYAPAPLGMRGLRFRGDGVGKVATRSRWSVRTNDDLKITARVSKRIPRYGVDACANHFIVVTTQRFFRWSWEGEPETLKFVWNCSTKMIIAPTENVASSPCFPMPKPPEPIISPLNRTANMTLVTVQHPTTGTDSSVEKEKEKKNTWAAPRSAPNNKNRVTAVSFLEFDGDENNDKEEATLSPECTAAGKRMDLQAFHPSLWCYELQGKGRMSKEAMCKKSYVSKHGKGEFIGNKRVALCEWHPKTETCKKGRWANCGSDGTVLPEEEEALTVEANGNEDEQEEDAADLSKIVSSTVEIFIAGLNKRSTFVNTKCGALCGGCCNATNDLSIGAGFSSTDKLFVFIGAAPAVPAARKNATFAPLLPNPSGSDTGVVAVHEYDARGDETFEPVAVFESFSISGSLSAESRVEGTEVGLSLSDCEVSAWSQYSTCTAECEGGTKFRTRNITVPQRDGGSACPPLRQEVQCNLRTCDCTVTNYTDWGPCNVKCGGGLQWKTREVVLYPVADGEMCPDLNFSRQCNTMDCAVEGLPFGGVERDESEDDAEVEEEAEAKAEPESGMDDPVRNSTEGNVGSSDNSTITGENVRFKREIVTGVTTVLLPEAPYDHLRQRDEHSWCYQKPATLAPYAYGYLSDEFVDARGDNPEVSDEEEEREEEIERGDLNVTNTTGGALMSAKGKPTMDNSAGVWFSGEATERPTMRSRRSFQAPLRIDAVLDLSEGANFFFVLSSERWMTWNSNPTIEAEPATLKFAFTGYDKQIVVPNGESHVRTCPRGWYNEAEKAGCHPAILGQDVTDGKCTATGDRRSCLKIYFGGRRACRWEVQCPPGIPQAWDPVTLQNKCDFSVAAATRRAVNITIDVTEDGTVSFLDGGTDCGGIAVSRHDATPANAGWADFLSQEEAPARNMFLYVGAARTSKSAQGGLAGRSLLREIRVSGKGANHNVHNGSRACPARNDCQVSAWEPWGTCSKVCGGGVHSRRRVVVTPASYGGAACPELHERNVPCNTQICGRDCEVSAWGKWEACSVPCSVKRYPWYHALHDKTLHPEGDGIQVRRRSILNPLINGSHFGHDECPVLNQTRHCNKRFCGTDCTYSPWTPWSNCSQPCGGGASIRVRVILKRPDPGSHFGHDPCGPERETRACNTQLCPRTPPEPIPKIDGGRCARYSQHSRDRRPDWDRKNHPHFRGVGNAAANTDTCSACVSDPGCGFCPNSGLCLEGVPSGPVPRFENMDQMPVFGSKEDLQKVFMYAANCSSWQFAQCSPEPCRSHESCGDCLADPYCGWCGMTGRCEEGNQAGSVGEYCPRGWMASPMHAAWGPMSGRARRRDRVDPDAKKSVDADASTDSNMEADADADGPNAEDDDEDDNDVWLQSVNEQLDVLAKLPDICAANTREADTLVRKKLGEEIDRQARLRKARETCAPCEGTWPFCDCGGNAPGVNDTRIPMRFGHVVRTRDAAIDVDYTLPRRDAVADAWNHGKPRKSAGDTCLDHKECTSDSCVRTIGSSRLGKVCCHEQLRHCSGHGECVEMGTQCRCDAGFYGDDCGAEIQPETQVKQKEVDPLDKFGSMLGGLNDESWMEG